MCCTPRCWQDWRDLFCQARAQSIKTKPRIHRIAMTIAYMLVCWTPKHGNIWCHCEHRSRNGEEIKKFVVFCCRAFVRLLPPRPPFAVLSARLKPRARCKVSRHRIASLLAVAGLIPPPPTLPRSPPSSSCRARANSNGGQRDARPILRRIPRPFMFARLSKPARLRKKKESPQKGVRSKTKGAGIEGVGIHFAWHAGK